MGRGIHADSLRIIDAAQEILEQIEPASVRAICYKLFVVGLIPDMGKSSTDKVSRLLVRAREDGTIPWEWIVDGGRAVQRVATWADPRQRMNSALRSYRLDYWRDQPNRVHVVAEKETVASTLRPVLDEYAVPVSFMKGFASATAVNDLAEVADESEKPLHLIYVGDWDPSGLYMSEVDLPGRMDRYSQNGGTYSITRIAVTLDQALQFRLPHFPASDKRTDARHDWFTKNHGDRCWELDALDPNILRSYVDEAIFDLIDHDAWEHCQRIEAAQRESMGSFLSKWPASGTR